MVGIHVIPKTCPVSGKTVIALQSMLWRCHRDPQARQVANRLHLLHNLRDMVERALHIVYAELKQLLVAPEHFAALQPLRPKMHRTTTGGLITTQHHQVRLERYKRIQALRDEGYNISRITREAGLSRTTVRKYYYAQAFPERKKAPLRPSKIDRFLPYLQQQIAAGVENALQLFREIHIMGYTGGTSSSSMGQ